MNAISSGFCLEAIGCSMGHSEPEIAFNRAGVVQLFIDSIYSFMSSTIYSHDFWLYPNLKYLNMFVIANDFCGG